MAEISKVQVGRCCHLHHLKTEIVSFAKLPQVCISEREGQPIYLLSSPFQQMGKSLKEETRLSKVRKRACCYCN